MKFIQQNEQAECGLACLLMIGNHLGHDMDLTSARLRFQPSLRGMNLPQLIAIAGKLGLRTRPLKVEVPHLSRLSLPSILHWDFNHFVVLEQVTPKGVTVLDPARGRLTLTLNEVSESFTGVAIETTKADTFVAVSERKSIPFSKLFGNFKQVLRDIPLLAATVAVAELVALFMPVLLKQLLDSGAIAGPTSDNLLPISAYILFCGVSLALSVVRSGLLTRTSNRLFVPGGTAIFEHLLRLPHSFFQSRHYSDVASKFDSLAAIHRIVSLRLVDAILSGILTAVLIVALAAYDGGIALVVLAAISLALLLQVAASPKVTQLSTEALVAASKQSNEFHQTLRGIQTIQVFGMSGQRLARWMNHFVAATSARSKEQMAFAVLAASQKVIFSCSMLAIVSLCVQRIQAEGWSGGILVLVTTYAVQALARSEALTGALGELRGLSVHQARISDILLTEAVPSLGTLDDLPQSVSIELRGVWFRHSPDEPWILKNANLKIAAGESVAIVGPSGAGKTTIVKLILGLLEPVRGEVLVNGVSTTTGGREILRECAASVLQDDRLFNGSLAENIGLFAFDLSLDKVKRCAEIADIADDVEAMPMKFHTLIGDTAGGLSGGQRQRVLLARALYAEPLLLVLDEATSHLDVARESSINEQISQLNMTRIIVAHRPQTISSAGRIVDVRQICDER